MFSYIGTTKTLRLSACFSLSLSLSLSLVSAAAAAALGAALLSPLERSLFLPLRLLSLSLFFSLLLFFLFSSQTGFFLSLSLFLSLSFLLCIFPHVVCVSLFSTSLSSLSLSSLSLSFLVEFINSCEVFYPLFFLSLKGI